MLKQTLSLLLSILLLVPHSLLANTSGAVDDYIFKNNNGGMIKGYFDRFVHLSEEEIRSTYHKDHPLWSVNNVRPMTDIRNAGFMEDFQKEKADRPGRYFRVVQAENGEVYRRILFKQLNVNTGQYQVQYFDVPYGTYENSAFKPTKFRQTLKDPRFLREVTIRLGMDTLGFYLAGNMVQRAANSYAGVALGGAEAYQEILNNGMVPTQVKSFIYDLLNMEKMMLGESLIDPMFYENELLRLKDPHGWVHFGAFIGVNRMMSEFGQFYTPQMGGTGNPNSLNKFQKSAVWAGKNPFASMAVASIGASIITEVGFGVYNCTLPRIIKLSYGLVNMSQEEIDQKLFECDRVMEETVTGKVFERWMYDTFFSLLPAVFLSHSIQGLINGKTYAMPAQLYNKTKGLAIKASSALGLSKAEIDSLSKSNSTVNTASSNIANGAKNKTQFLQGVRNAKVSKKLSDKLISEAMKSKVQYAGVQLQKVNIGGKVSWAFNGFKYLHQRTGKLLTGGPIRMFGVQTFNFAVFLWSMSRTRYYAVPFEVWKHSRHVDSAARELKTNVERLLGYGPVNNKELSNAKNSVTTDSADSAQTLKDNIYHFGRMHEDWRNYVLADSNMAFSNWLTYTSKLQQKYDASTVVYEDLVSKTAEYFGVRDWTKISQPTRDALETAQTTADYNLFYFSEVAPRLQASQAQEISKLNLEALYPREDMAKYSRTDQAIMKLTLIKEQAGNFKSKFKSQTVEDIKLKQDAEKIILGLTRDISKMEGEYQERGLSKEDARKYALSDYYKSLNQTIKDLNQIVDENAPEAMVCMNQQQSSEFSYCDLSVLHFMLGSPGHLGERYLKNQARVLVDPQGVVRANDDFRDEVVGNIHTDNMAEYLLAQSVCGPDVESTHLPQSVSWMLTNYYDLQDFQVKKIEACYAEEVKARSGFLSKMWNAVTSKIREEDSENQELYYCIREHAPEFEQSEMLRNIRGVSLDFMPPRLVDRDMSYVCNQLREAQKTNVSKSFDGSKKSANVYNWSFNYKNNEGETKTASSMFEVLLQNINPELISTSETEFYSNFNSWWGQSATVMYKRRMAEAHIKYKALVSHVIKPTLFGIKNSSELWDPSSKNRWSSSNINTRQAETFSDDKWNRHNSFGAYDSIALELQFYLDDILKPIAQLKNNSTEWDSAYNELRSDLNAAIDIYVFEERKLSRSDENSSNEVDNIKSAFNNILQVTAGLIEHMGLAEYKSRFQLDADTPMQGHTKYSAKDEQMQQYMTMMSGQKVTKSELTDVQKATVDQTVKNMTASILMLSQLKDLVVRLDMMAELNNPEDLYK